MLREVQNRFSPFDIEFFARLAGAAIERSPGLHCEAIIPREGKGPLILLPAEWDQEKCSLVIAATLFMACLETVDYESAIACWRTLFQGTPSAIALSHVREWSDRAHIDALAGD